MRWFELLDNPAAITEVYARPPELDAVVVREVMFAYGGLRLTCDVAQLPDRAAAAGESGCVRLNLAFWKIADLAISNDPCEQTVALSLTRLADGALRLALTGNECRLSAQCRTVMIESFQPMTGEYPRLNERTLRNYRNVWNSCLLLLRAAGYEFRIVGDQDPDGKPSYCSWHAKQGELVLIASNPIELLGLAEVARKSAVPTSEAYWWQIEGSNIANELVQEWLAKWKGPEA